MFGNDEVKCFLIGLGLGAAAGLLFAPGRGSETRQLLQAKAKEGTDYLKNQAADLVDAAAEGVEKGSKSIRYQKENLAAAVEAGRSAYAEAAAATPGL